MRHRFLLIKYFYNHLDFSVLPYEIFQEILCNYILTYDIYTSKHIIKSDLVKLGFKNLDTFDKIVKYLYKFTSLNKYSVTFQRLNSMERAAVYKFGKLHNFNVIQIDKKGMHADDNTYICKKCKGDGSFCECCYPSNLGGQTCIKCNGSGFTKGYFLETLKITNM